MNRLRFLNDLFQAVSLLTILPTHRWIITARDPLATPMQRPLGYSFAYYPLVGLMIGGIMVSVQQLSLPVFHISAPITAFMILSIWIIFTGGLHLDGFADCCDGLLPSLEPSRRLAIMKDPHVGAWAVVGIVLLLLGKWLLLSEIVSELAFTAPLILCLPPMFGRCAMVIHAALFPSARPDGMGALFRVGLGRDQVIVAVITSVVVTLAMGWHGAWHSILALVIAIAISYGFSQWASNRLGGGLSGDVYGAIVEMVELITLVIILAIHPL